MTLLIDYGSASAKALLLQNEDSYQLIEVPFPFSASVDLAVFEGFLFVLERLETLFGQKLFSGGNLLCKVYLAGEVASVRLREVLSGEIEEPFALLKSLEWPIVSVDAESASLGGRIFRGYPPGEDLISWLPFKAAPAEMEVYCANRRLFLSVLPYAPRDLEIEQALATVKIRKCLEGERWTAGEAYLTGTVFSSAPRAELAFLTALNGLQPGQPLRLVLDRRGILLLLALLRKAAPEKYLPVAEKEKKQFLSMGTAVRIKPPSSVRVEVEGRTESQEIRVTEETLTVFPLGEGETARVSGEGMSEVLAEGGAVGLVFDSRPCPLRLSESSGERRGSLRDWARAINAHGEIEEIWKNRF